jgi:hypothetical protein
MGRGRRQITGSIPLSLAIGDPAIQAHGLHGRFPSPPMPLGLSLRLQRPLHERGNQRRALHLIRHAIAYQAILPLLRRPGGDDPTARELYGGLRFPGALRFVIAADDGHGGQNMAPLGWPAKAPMATTATHRASPLAPSLATCCSADGSGQPVDQQRVPNRKHANPRRRASTGTEKRRHRCRRA